MSLATSTRVFLIDCHIDDIANFIAVIRGHIARGDYSAAELPIAVRELRHKREQLSRLERDRRAIRRDERRLA